MRMRRTSPALWLTLSLGVSASGQQLRTRKDNVLMSQSLNCSTFSVRFAQQP